MLTALRLPSWNATTEPEPDVVLDSVSVKRKDPPEDPKQERGNRLFQDLIDGTTECPICSEEIDAEAQMWSCKDCYHIYHFGCIKRWVENQSRISWLCPTCKSAQYGAAANMTPSCWCGRQPYADISNRGNTCGATCLKPTKCDFNPTFPCRGSCSKPCHPGPCEPVACKDRCLSMRDVPLGRIPKTANVSSVNQVEREEAANPNAAAPEPAGQPEPRQESAPSPFSKPSDCFGAALTGFIMLVILESPFWYWQISRIDRWTRPLQHKHFTEHKRILERKWTLSMIIFFTIIFMNIALNASSALYPGLKLLFKVSRKNCLVKALIYGLVTCIWFLSSWNVFIISPVGLGQAWKNQMKNSCNGFDTMIKLDTIEYWGVFTESHPKTEVSLFNPIFPFQILPQGINDFEFTNTTGKSPNPAEAFSTYYRMTGTLSPSTHMAVDFDLNHQLWRIMHPTHSDPTSNALTPPTNTFSTLFKNGTWTSTTTSSPHVFIPELGLQIPNMHYYTKHCVYQAFMKVYSTVDNTEEEIKEQGDRKWSDRNEKEVVMRTVAFGSSPRGLEVCARRDDYVVDGEERRGLRDDVVVPLGLMAVLRLQMSAEGKMEEGCQWLD